MENKDTLKKVKLNREIFNFNTIIAFISLIVSAIALIIVCNQFNIQKREDNSNIIQDYFVLDNLYYEIKSLKSFTDLYPDLILDSLNTSKTIVCLNDLKSLVYSGINNNLLKKHNKIYSQWWVFYSQTDFTIKILEEESMLEKYYEIPQKHGYAIKGKEVSKNIFDIETLKDFIGYFKTFWIKGVEPMLNINEVKYYNDKYIGLSNWGRPIRE